MEKEIKRNCKKIQSEKAGKTQTETKLSDKIKPESVTDTLNTSKKKDNDEDENIDIKNTAFFNRRRTGNTNNGILPRL